MIYMANKAIRLKGKNDTFYPCPYYPVGSIYISVINENPTKWFGGTWVSWGSGRVPVGVNTSDSNFSTVEKTGGSSTHTHTNSSTKAASGNTGSTTLTVNQIPGHTHTNCIYNKNNENYTSSLSGTGYLEGGILSWSNGTVTTAGGTGGDSCGVTRSTGGGQGHTHSLNGHTHTLNNTGSSSTLQPYITCYMWKRIA